MIESVRFLAVATLGLILDLALAWSVAHFLALPLWLAALAGFMMAAVANYVLHEVWTFQNGARKISAWRSVLYVCGLTVAAVSRLAAVLILTAIIPSAPALFILAMAASASFAVSFLVSKHFVFGINKK